jgi:hypothetical protein
MKNANLYLIQFHTDVGRQVDQRSEEPNEDSSAKPNPAKRDGRKKRLNDERTK